MKTLSPCPFCGNSDIFLWRELHPKCRKCGATQCYVAGHAAIESWNHRKIPHCEAEKPQEPVTITTQKRQRQK